MATKKYSFTSGAFKGEVLLEFFETELLCKYDASAAELSEEQQKWFLQKLPRELSEVQRVLQGSPTAKLTEIKETVSFEAFWDRYNDKVRSSRKKSLAKWQRMSHGDRARAYYFIVKYENNIPAGVSKKYAETYLNAELWNN